MHYLCTRERKLLGCAKQLSSLRSLIEWYYNSLAGVRCEVSNWSTPRRRVVYPA